MTGLDPRPEPGDPRARLLNQAAMIDQLNAGAMADPKAELAYKTRCLARYCQWSQSIHDHLDAVHMELVGEHLPPRIPGPRIEWPKEPVAELPEAGKVSVD